MTPEARAACEACLPPPLRRPTTTITKIAAGLSGAGVYRVDGGGEAFVLKIATHTESAPAWRRKVALQELAAAAGVAPRVVHVDETHRAVTSAFIVDRGFPPLYFNPATREVALALLAGTLRRVHSIPLPADTGAADHRGTLVRFRAGLADFAVPAFARDAIERMLAEPPPPRERAQVLSHNDVNPSNLAYDGERLLLLDWDISTANDPFHDLATASVFLRMDEATCRALLAAYDASELPGEPVPSGYRAPVAPLPAGFAYSRRLVATFCGTVFLHLARHAGHAGDAAAPLEPTASLADCYQRMRAGNLDVSSADGKWTFGLALIKQSLEC